MKDQFDTPRDLSPWSQRIKQRSGRLIEHSLRLRQRMNEQFDTLRQYKQLLDDDKIMGSLVWLLPRD